VLFAFSAADSTTQNGNEPDGFQIVAVLSMDEPTPTSQPDWSTLIESDIIHYSMKFSRKRKL
jgi:hypothetical protein